MRVTTGNKIPTMTALTDLLKSDTALKLYFSEFRTGSRNSNKLLVFQNLSLSVSVFYYLTRKCF